MLDLNIRLNDTYTLTEEIGEGGGGVVYKAYHERLRIYVVVKRIKNQVRGMLESRVEADILKKMKHTYLPRVYDFLEIDGEIYTVIDFIPGESLDKAVAEHGAYTQKQVLKWARQLSEALDYLHRQKPPVIHSDIKPANIMLTPDGDICLIDFNISLALDSTMKTSTGISGGYSAPEQYHDVASYRRLARIEKRVSEQPRNASGNKEKTQTDAAFEETAADGAPEETAADGDLDETRADVLFDRTVTDISHGENAAYSTMSGTQSIVEETVGRGVDERSDVYSLGATLYHLLTGIKPALDFDEVIPLSKVKPDLSEGLIHIIEKMMSLKPENRYQNGTEVLEAFRNIYELDSEYRAYKNKRRARNILIAALYAAGILLTAGGRIAINNENNVSYNALITAAESAIEAGDYDAAGESLSQAQALFPERLEAYEKEALSLYESGDYEGCISFVQQLLRDVPYSMSDYDESIMGDLYYVLGNACLESDDYANAVLYLETAIVTYGSNSFYYRDYAIALAKQGNTALAAEVLYNATLLGLSEDSIYMVQGEISYADGEFETAVGYLQQTIASSGDDTLRRRAVLLCDKAYRALGTEYIDDEIAFLEQQSLYFSGTNVEPALTERLADAYVRKAQSDEAVSAQYYEKALESFLYLYESGYSARQMMENIAIIYQQLDEFDLAQEMLLDMVDKYPDSYEGYMRLAYLEADRQQEKDYQDRNYLKMREYYELAKELYGDQGDDQEMEMLELMMAELEEGGWF